MIGRKGILYRGKAEEKYPPRRKQNRDLVREKLQDFATVWTFGGASILVLIIAIHGYWHRDPQLFWQMLLLFAFGAVLTLALADATQSVNPFRPGFDSDTSDTQRHVIRDDEHPPDP